VRLGFIGRGLWRRRKGSRGAGRIRSPALRERWRRWLAVRAQRHYRGKERKETRGRKEREEDRCGADMRDRQRSEGEAAAACGWLARGRLTAWGQERSEGRERTACSA